MSPHQARAAALTNDQLATRLAGLAETVTLYRPAERSALLAEAATRLAAMPDPDAMLAMLQGGGR
jgi:hypothetical protein